MTKPTELQQLGRLAFCEEGTWWKQCIARAHTKAKKLHTGPTCAIGVVSGTRYTTSDENIADCRGIA